MPFHERKGDFQVLLGIAQGKLPTWPTDDAELHISLRNRGLVDKLKVVCSYCWKDKKERASIREIMKMLDNIQEYN